MIFEESRLRFNFDNNIWTRLKKVDGHVDYRKLEVLNGSKAVDFLGLCRQTLFFIEVKNFRNSRITGHEVLTIKVASKIKDTIAAMVGGARNSTHERQDWKYYVSHLINEHEIKAVFWLEENNPNAKRNKAGLSFYANSLKTKLKWLTGGGNHVFIIDDLNTIEGLTVTNLPI